MTALEKLRRAFGLLLERRGQVVAGLACTPLSALVVLWIALLLGDVVDALRGVDVEDAYGVGELGRDCLVLAALATADAVLRFTARRQLINASRHMEARLKSELAAHLERLPIAWFDKARTGDLLSRMTQDVELLRFVTGPTLLYGSSSLFLVPGGVWVMLQLSPLVAAAAFVAFLLMLGGIALLMPGIQRRSKAVQESIAEISQRAAESFNGVRVLLAFARARDEVATMRALSDDYVEHNVGLARVRAWLNVLIHGCRELVVLAVVVLGAIEVGRGELTVGEMLSFLALLGAIVWPLIALGWIASSWHRAIAAADRIEEVFDAEPEPRGGRTEAGTGRIEVRGLTFTYPGHARPALADVSVTIERGQKIGLVGPVGSGKSTLLAILLRLYDPPRGTVFLDGVDLLDIDPAAVRARFASAPQEPFLFSDTLAGNIRFGGALPPDDDVAVGDAASLASLDRDLHAFPAGWQTIVGERGVTLSGGQKQRVSLARALAADRDALLLDDTLSAVDLATERRILGNLDRERRGRTMVVVAHRLSIVRDADLVLVFEGGRVTARGAHDELVAKPGFYADTWRRQSEENLLEQGLES